MSKGQTKKTREAAGNRRKLTRAEKKQIAEAIRKAKGDGKARTAQQTMPYQEADRKTLYGAINWAVSIIRKYSLLGLMLDQVFDARCHSCGDDRCFLSLH